MLLYPRSDGAMFTVYVKLLAYLKRELGSQTFHFLFDLFLHLGLLDICLLPCCPQLGYLHRMVLSGL